MRINVGVIGGITVNDRLLGALQALASIHAPLYTRVEALDVIKEETGHSIVLVDDRPSPEKLMEEFQKQAARFVPDTAKLQKELLRPPNWNGKAHESNHWYEGALKRRRR